MKTPEELKAQKAKQMREYRVKLKEANPEAFLEKQRIQKQKLRAKAKESKIFEVPYVEPKKSVKIKVIKKAIPPPLPSKFSRWPWRWNPTASPENGDPLPHL